jgi:hypothetical protein
MECGMDDERAGGYQEIYDLLLKRFLLASLKRIIDKVIIPEIGRSGIVMKVTGRFLRRLQMTSLAGILTKTDSLIISCYRRKADAYKRFTINYEALADYCGEHNINLYPTLDEIVPDSFESNELNGDGIRIQMSLY